MKKKKKTTINDIAQELNITASTVSRALQDHPRISDATKKEVLKTAKQLNYHPNNIAAALRKGKSNLIGVMVPGTDENFFASAIRGIEEVANKAGYRVLITQSNDSYEKEKTNVDAMLEAQVDGIIASIAMGTKEVSHFQKIIDRGIPLILFDRFNETVDANIVALNDYQGAYKAVEHLIEQGCKRIVHFAGYQNISIYKERFRGYKDALEDHDISFDENLVFECDMKLESGQKLAKKLLTMSELPDGIFSSSDNSAMGAMQVLKANNVKIPDQIAIVGFSNETFSSFVEPALSTVEQHSKKMGQLSAKLFLEQLEPNVESEPLTRKIILTPKLIIRDSSLIKEKDSNSKRVAM
ncbi:MAG TPA: LacI family DNA-binding transcriptional regulator [Balneolales bacterium]|nr:LacI family DNA-binding transcriptional regulator [Balneolales bacterium]